MQRGKMTPYQEKSLDERRTAFATICNQFPVMLELKDVLKGNPEEFRQQYAPALIQAVSKALDIPPQGVDILGGKPYVNKTGLTCKVQKDPRRVKRITAIPMLLPLEINMLNKPDDDLYKKYFIGTTKDGTAMFKGIVEFEDGSIFTDEGSANAKYLNREFNKMATMVPYVMELASTRASNRAMRLATGIGLVSVEELNSRGFQMIQEGEAKKKSPEKTKLVEEITAGFGKLNLNAARQMAICNRFGGVPAIEEMKPEGIEVLVTEVRNKIARKTKVNKKPKAKAQKGVKRETENTDKKQGSPGATPKKAGPHLPQPDPGGPLPFKI